MNPPRGLPGEVSGLLRRSRWLFLAEGVALVLLGVAAISVPTFATLALEVLVGWILLFSGIIGAVTTLSMRHAAGFTWSLVSAMVGIAAGTVLLRWPLSGTVSLTLILIVFFLLEGFASIMFALDHRRHESRRWVWLLVSGAVDLLLAAMILAGLPGTATWAIGLLVGINMVFGGAALLAMAMEAKGIGVRPGKPDTAGDVPRAIG